MKKRDLSKPGSDPLDYKEALQRAAAMCSRQEQCSSHIRDKLREWDVGEEDTEKIICLLKEEKYLDDHRFAGFYARDKFRFNGWGKIKIAHMLRQKGISGEATEQALDQIGDEEYFLACVNLIRGKSASLKDKNLFTRKGKLFRFAAGRGFETDLIHRAISQVEKE